MPAPYGLANVTNEDILLHRFSSLSVKLIKLLRIISSVFFNQIIFLLSSGGLKVVEFYELELIATIQSAHTYEVGIKTVDNSPIYKFGSCNVPVLLWLLNTLNS